MTGSAQWTMAEIGRLLYTHALDPDLAVGALAISVGDARRLVGGKPLNVAIAADRAARAALLLNILVRVEMRCGHDPVAIRVALNRPLDALGGASIAERLLVVPSLATLRVLREAAGTMPVPKVKMWRVPDRYS